MKRLLVIAAGYLQTFLIKKAKALGYHVIAIDGNPNAIGFRFADESACIDITDPEACIRYASSKHINGVVTAASDYGVISAGETAKALKLPGLNPEVARLIKNKFLVRKCLFQKRVDDTQQAYQVDETTDICKISKTLVFPVMVKPCDGSGSRGASRVDCRDELAPAIKYAIDGSLTHRAIIESFITGQEYGVESFVYDGEVHILGVMKKWMTVAPYYAELGHAIPSGLSTVLEAKVRNCVTSAIKALGVNFGSVNMDLLITADCKVHIVDVGARMGGNLIGSHIIPMGTGVDYMGAIIQAAMGDKVNLKGTEVSNVATKLLALTPGRVVSLPNFESLEKTCDVKIEHHLSVGDEITSYRTNLDGCGYIIATGESAAEAECKAAKALALLDKTIQRAK
ncbi:MAG: ATP-grasp domain-containing protein [Muribaculaceae bacterium]|nr:ATP-grasp domain-containing protein [Muribaculaceae bacterium]